VTQEEAAQLITFMLGCWGPQPPERLALWTRTLTQYPAGTGSRSVMRMIKREPSWPSVATLVAYHKAEEADERSRRQLGMGPVARAPMPEWVRRWVALRLAGDDTVLPEQMEGYEALRRFNGEPVHTPAGVEYIGSGYD
jgi:hypothetical protein